MVVSAFLEPAELWRNISPTEGHWLQVKLQGVFSNRDGIGARVKIGNQVQEYTASQGYSSSSLAGLHFGLGAAKMVTVEVEWPGGTKLIVNNVTTDSVITIKEQ